MSVECKMILTCKTQDDILCMLKDFADTFFPFHIDENTKSIEGENIYGLYRIEFDYKKR